MTKETKNRIHLIYSIVLSAAAILAGICFIVSAQSIYRSGLAAGTQPYTTETISAAFSRIAVPVWIFLALVIGGMLLNILLPQEKKKQIPEKNQQLLLQRLEAKADLSACDASLRKDIEKERAGRRLHTIIGFALLAVASALFLSYACNGANWAPVGQATQINACMLRAVFAMLICLCIPFAYIVTATFLARRSRSREIELLRQAAAQAPRTGTSRPAVAPKGSSECIVRYTVLALALGLLIYGACTGGTVDVLAKAAAICTECVGLG